MKQRYLAQIHIVCSRCDVVIVSEPPPSDPEKVDLLSAPSAAAFEQFLLRDSLYAPKPIDDPEGKRFLYFLRARAFQFDAYCVFCKRESHFKAPTESRQLRPYPVNSKLTLAGSQTPGYFDRYAECSRNSMHDYWFHFRVDAGGVQKIGQYPSLQDVAGAELRRFRSVLSPDDLAELNKATGLFSHGVGIGSFVYLRRIFERLIEAHRADFEEANGAIPNWVTMRMADRIKALGGVLPPALVKNASIYGILSKGIHELSEDQCKSAFPAMRSAIILILQQDLEAKQRAKNEADLQKEIGKLSGEFGGV